MMTDAKRNGPTTQRLQDNGVQISGVGKGVRKVALAKAPRDQLEQSARVNENVFLDATFKGLESVESFPNLFLRRVRGGGTYFVWGGAKI